MNPLDLDGLVFMPLYVGTMVAALLLEFWADFLRRPNGRPAPGSLETLSPADAGLLKRGDDGFADATLAQLVHQGRLVFSEQSSTFIVGADGAPLDAVGYRRSALVAASGVERDVLDAAGVQGGASLGELRAVAARHAGHARERLTVQRLLMRRAHRFVVQVARRLPMIAVGVFGALKVQVGMSRGKPVAFLGACVLLMVYGILRPRGPLTERTLRGDEAVAWFEEENAALEATMRTAPMMVTAREAGLALALFPAHVAKGGPWAPMAGTMAESMTASATGSATGGSSFWSSGGSSCGASCGGGCGGGCGGCGGCG